MKSNQKKIAKLLKKSDEITRRLYEGTKNDKKREKKLDRAQQLCERALELCRKDVANGVTKSGDGLLNPVRPLAAILFRRERYNEAEPLLEEIYKTNAEYGDSPLLTECMGYYGSILCESGRFDTAAEVLDGFLCRVRKELPDGESDRDMYALCRGLGNAACAFTYADNGEGYPSEGFIYPVEALCELQKKQVDVGQDNLKKAYYYAASQQLFITCYDTVPVTSVSQTEEYAAKCVSLCRKDDLYHPAALRLLTLARARGCRFADAAETGRMTLDECSVFSGKETRAHFASLQGIAGDMNLLLGIFNYRASRLSESIRFFEAAVASYEADAKGRPLREVGCAEAETEIISMTNAEKCAFACKYTGLAKFSDRDRYPVEECVRIMRRGAELVEVTNPVKPYFMLLVSADYHIIAQMCERADDSELAASLDALSREKGMSALTALHSAVGQKDLFEQYAEEIRIHRRIALRLGLLELYADYTRIEIMLSEPPYSPEENHSELARLNFEMGECCRVVGRNESAVDYLNEVRTHTLDRNGKPYDVTANSGIYEFSLVSCASCLVKCGEIAKARRVFREFVNTQRDGDGVIEKSRLVKIAGLSRDVGLNPAECAGYLNEAASALEENESDWITSSELYNQEGICWYNASPVTDIDMHELTPAELSSKLDEFARKELAAFENAIRMVGKCDGNDEKIMVLKPSLHSNTGECYMRKEEYGTATEHYYSAAAAFETLFETAFFRRKAKEEQESYLFQYALCFKSLGDIYNQLDDNPNCMKVLTQAISVMEKLSDPAVRSELAACLNARGVVHFRLGEYKQNVEDATRAISLKKDDDGSEINMAIMLKNRSDAYRELGDFKSMQSDLTDSINMLDKSELPDDMLSQFYGSHWFSMGVCQEGLNKIGKAADAYRKAAGYMDKNKNADDSDAYMKALCHFRRAICLCRREEQEYYGALYEYNKAIKLVEGMPASDEKNENLRKLLSSRGSLYEAFREIDLAKADFHRAESLRAAPDTVK